MTTVTAFSVRLDEEGVTDEIPCPVTGTCRDQSGSALTGGGRWWRAPAVASDQGKGGRER
jgi:hypothetical protein